MLRSILSYFYERDIRKLIEEVNLFRNEEDLWKTRGSVKNSCGNLALHIIGGTNYLFGTILSKSGYVRNRDLDFTQKDINRAELVGRLEALIPLIKGTLDSLGDDGMEAEYPILFDNVKNSNAYVLTQLSLHLNYHLGQVNYLRRILE